MDGIIGRHITLYWGSTPIAKLTTKGVSINNELVDDTGDTDGAWRNILNEPGTKTVSFSASGVVVNKTLLQAALDEDNVVNDMTFEYPDGGRITGNFGIEGYSETGERAAAATFEATFQNKGAVTYAAGA